MKDEAEKKQKLIEKFVEASLSSYKAQEEGKARIVNRNYDKKVKIRAELKDDLESYKELFTPLLEHENAHVDWTRQSRSCRYRPRRPRLCLKRWQRVPG